MGTADPLNKFTREDRLTLAGKLAEAFRGVAINGAELLTNVIIHWDEETGEEMLLCEVAWFKTVNEKSYGNALPLTEPPSPTVAQQMAGILQRDADKTLTKIG